MHLDFPECGISKDIYFINYNLEIDWTAPMYISRLQCTKLDVLTLTSLSENVAISLSFFDSKHKTKERSGMTR